MKRKVGLSLGQTTAGSNTQEKKIGHFNVLSQPLSGISKLKPPLDLELDGDCTKGSSTARDYLRVYYSDYLGVEPAKGPDYADAAGASIDCEEWVRWMQQAQPRTRVDAYPLLLVCKDLLRRVAARDVRVVSHRNEELAAALARAETHIVAQDHELCSLRSELRVRPGDHRMLPLPAPPLRSPPLPLLFLPSPIPPIHPTIPSLGY